MAWLRFGYGVLLQETINKKEWIYMAPDEIQNLIVKAQQRIQLILKNLESDAGVTVTGFSIKRFDVTKINEEHRSYTRYFEINTDSPTNERWS